MRIEETKKTEPTPSLRIEETKKPETNPPLRMKETKKPTMDDFFQDIFGEDDEK